MSSELDTSRIVRSWLDEGVTELPDRVLDAVLDQVPSTPQRRVTWWPARRPSTARFAAATALATAVVAVITLIGLGVLGGDRVGGPGADEPTPTPARALPTGLRSIEPGRYTLAAGFPADLTFDVPDGWDACVYGVLEQGLCSPSGDAGGVAFLAVDNVVVHPCDTRLLDPPAGRSVEAFLSAVRDLSGFSVSEPVAITRSGLPGHQMTVTAPADPQCGVLRTWSVPDRVNGVHAGEVNVIEVFDVGGQVVAIVGSYRASVLSAEELAALRSIMESVEFRP